MKNLSNSIQTTMLTVPAVETVTLNSAEIDTQGFSANRISFFVGQSGDTLSGSIKWNFKLQESDISGSGFANVADENVYEDENLGTVDSDSDDEQVYHFNYRGNCRYLRGIATATGTHSNGTPMSIVAFQANGANEPLAG